MASTAGPTTSLVGIISAYTESSFANDESSNLASFTPIPVQEGTGQVTLTRETHNPMQLRQNILDYQSEILGKKMWKLQWTMPLAPTGTSAGDGTTAIQGALGLLLSTCWGVEQLDKGTTVTTSWPTAGGGNIATSANITKGAFVGWLNGSSQLEARHVIQNSSGVQVRPRFSTSPATDDVIYAAATYAMSQDPTSTLNFAVRGAEADDAWLLMGGQLDSMSLSLPLDGTIPTVQFTWMGTNWLHETDTTAGSFASISAATYSGFDPIVGYDGSFLYGTPTQLTGTTVHISSVNFKSNVKYVSITSPSGDNGVKRWRLVRDSGTPVFEGDFTTYYEDDTWFTNRDALTTYQFIYQIGTAAGSTVVIHGSTAQITDVQRGDSDQGISGVTVTWKGRLDAGVTSASADIDYSPGRIAFL